MSGPSFDWTKEGFAAPPQYREATATDRLYRAWGNHSEAQGNEKGAGVCFSLVRPTSRADAERLNAIMEYGNGVRYVTVFSVKPGCPLWVGPICGGDVRAALEGTAGTQAFVERAFMPSVVELTTRMLHDDLGMNDVFAGRPPRVDS